MRCNRTWILIASFFPLLLSATPDVSLDVNRFRSESSSYIEVSMYIVGSSLTCLDDAHEYGVEYVVLVKDKSENVVAANRYRLSKQGCPAKDIIDVRRFTLNTGNYLLEVAITDVLDSTNTVLILQDVIIESATEEVKLSDLQLLSAVKADEGSTPFHKSGLYMEPLPFRYYYPSLSSMNLYIESYHADELTGQPYIRYTIRSLAGDIPSPIEAYRKVSKNAIGANVFQLDIRELISGPYELEAALFDGNKKSIATRKTYFTRYNPEGDSLFLASASSNMDVSFTRQIPEDSLDYYLKSMAPIVNSVYVEIMNTLLKKGNSKAKRFFIHRYWAEEAGKYAEQAFAVFQKVAQFTDELFRSGFGYGFETDRGHIFLKYGRPDDIIEVEDEPSAPPYEIWIYNDFPATHQSNVRFLFYNPSLTKNGHTLLHSTAIGEVKNARWEVELYKDATLETPGVNEKVMGDNVHRNARKYFENF